MYLKKSLCLKKGESNALPRIHYFFLYSKNVYEDIEISINSHDVNKIVTKGWLKINQ